MGSTESTLNPAMEDTTNAESTAMQDQHQQQQQRGHRSNTRRRLHRESESADMSAADDPWWWEVENENLILDQVAPPNIAATVGVSADSESAALIDDFNSLLKVGENAILTLNNANNNNNSDDVAAAITTTSVASENLSNKTEYPLIKNEDYPLAAVSAHATAIKALDTCISNAPTPREQSLEEFKEELRVKRLARQTAVHDLRDEIATLRSQLASEQALTRRLRSGECCDDSTATETVPDVALIETDTPSTADYDADDADAMSRGRHANIELANAQLALQLANSENLSLRTELGVVQKQVGTLKEVIACCKQMLVVKEEQCTQLKTKLTEIETSFGEREMKIMSNNLRQEYERQLGNIRQLRQLYEERQRISAAEHENLQRLISIKKDELLAEQEKTKNLDERNQTLLKEVETANNELATQREECNEHKFEKKALKEEMGAVNMLFSQMVMGFNGKNNLDIDRLTTMLEENRTLLNDMATKEASCTEGATLPKLLFELVEQAAVGSGKVKSRSATPTMTLEGEKDVAAEVETTATAESELVTGNEHENADMTLENIDDDATEPETTEKQQDVVDDAAADDMGDVAAAAAASIDYNADNDNDSSALIPSAKKHYRRNVSSKIMMMKIPSTSLCSSHKVHEPEVIGKVATAQEIIGNLPKVWKVLMELLSHHKIEPVQFEENGASEDCYKSVETPNGPKAELSVSKTYIKLKDLILEKKSLVKETNRLKTLNSHLDYRLNEQEKRLSAVSLELTKTWHLVGKMQRQHRQLHTQEQILRYQLQQKRRLLTELKEELEYCRRKWAAARAKNDESQEQYNDLRREFARRKLEDANNSTESGYSDSGPGSGSDEEERAAAAKAAAVKSAIVSGAVIAGSSSGNCRSKHLKEMFEHTRKIKRMQSTSPGRAGNITQNAEIVLRWNSAPPTCGWRGDEDDDDDDDEEDEGDVQLNLATNKGAVPKLAIRSSRSKLRAQAAGDVEESDEAAAAIVPIDVEQRGQRATRIQRLEEQCKSLIKQVLETSDNRERLEVQLCQFQDEIAPVQYAVPLDEFINKKRIERMTRASSAPVTGSGTLTAREEEYTRKRSERLGRLEEESRQLMSRIKRTSDRGHYLRCSLDRIRRAPSREGSFESNTEEELPKVEENITEEDYKASVVVNDELQSVDTNEAAGCSNDSRSALTAEEEAYTARRSARLQRLEEESKQLLTKLTRNSQRGGSLEHRLDALHVRYGSEEGTQMNSSAQQTERERSPPTNQPTIEQRIENIEKISTNREERLRILEEEGKQLLSRLTSTSERGTQMINRIAEREHNREARASATPSKDDAESNIKDDNSSTTAEPITVVAPLLPTAINVACSSIAGEELAERVTVTTTPSQIAAKPQGAIPKTKPLAQLCAARPKPTKQPSSNANTTVPGTETLEDMVKRLRDIPFPTTANIVEAAESNAAPAQAQEKEQEQEKEQSPTAK